MFSVFVGYLALFAVVLLGTKAAGVLTLSWWAVALVWWTVLFISSLTFMAYVCRKYPKQ